MSADAGERYRLNDRVAILQENIQELDRKLYGETQREIQLQDVVGTLEQEKITLVEEIRDIEGADTIELEAWKVTRDVYFRHLDMLADHRVHLAVTASAILRLQQEKEAAVEEVRTIRAILDKWGRVVILQKRMEGE